MSDLRPGTTMHRIAELERVTRDLRQDTRELRGLLEVAERRIRDLEDALNVATGRIAALECSRQQLWDHIGNMPGGV